MTNDVLRVATLTVPACSASGLPLLPDAPVPRLSRLSDVLVWAGLSAAFFLLSLMKAAHGLGLLRGFEDFLRGIFKQRGLYEDRRSLQIAASIAVAVVVMALIVWGLL